MKVFSKFDILGGYGENAIKIDVQILKWGSFFQTNSQKPFCTRVKSTESCWQLYRGIIIDNNEHSTIDDEDVSAHAC